MKLIPWTVPVALGLLLSVAEGSAQAQIVYQRPQTNPYGTPAFSPYLNLLRPGTNPAINYYGLVRPEIQTNSSIRQLQAQTSANANAIIDEQTGLAATGHTVQFQNTTHYFLNYTGAGGTQRTGAATPQSNFFTGVSGATVRPGVRPQTGAPATRK
jgi:hypothetical protein